MSKHWILLLAIGCASVSLGQTMPSTEPTAAVSDEPIALGKLFESRGAGIRLNPPAGGVLIPQVNKNDIARFVYSGRGWDIHLKMTTSSQPVPLSAPRDASGVGGLLELTVDQLKVSNPSAVVVSDEVREYPPYQVGIVAARYNAGINQIFAQQAIFRADDQTFYILQFSSAAGGAAEASAKQAFEMVLGTVKLLDREELRKDQNQRLYRTQEFLSLLDEKQIRAVLQPWQLLRVIRDGKDVGYVEVTEKPATHAVADGVEIVLKSRIVAPAAAPTTEPIGAEAAEVPAKTEQINRVATLFVSFDRRSEDWSVVTTIDDGGPAGPQTTTELGNSDRTEHQVLDVDAVKEHKVADAKDPLQPPVRMVEKYALSVSNYTKQRADKPVEQELPPFYLPQAMGELLPRLLPLDDVRTYMFASYVSGQRAVMARYVDVDGLQKIELDGRTQEAIVVKDRIGVDGSPTSQYMTRDGQWLGSVNEDQKLTVLPSDAETIRMLWPGAKFGEEAAGAQPAAGDGAGPVR